MGFVYILKSGDEDCFKIGKARDIEARVRDLATGNPRPWVVFDSIETPDEGDCEKFFHRTLQSRRVQDSGGREIFALTAAEATDAARQARDFLLEDLPLHKEAQALAKEDSDGRILEPGDRERELQRQLLQARVEKYQTELRCARLENSLKLVIGTAAGLDGIASWKTQTVPRFDETSFKRAEPKLHQAFIRETRQRPFRLK